MSEEVCWKCIKNGTGTMIIRVYIVQRALAKLGINVGPKDT